MAISKLKIFNKILIKLGAETVADVHEDVKSVRLINEIYDDIVHEELQKNNWVFAKKIKRLYNTAWLQTVYSFANLQLQEVNLVQKNEYRVTVEAKETGEQGNNIKLQTTSNKVLLSGQTLTGGTQTKKAKGEIVFSGNLSKGDKIIIGSDELTAGVDFSASSDSTKFFDLPSGCVLLLSIDGFNALNTYPYQVGVNKQYELLGRQIACLEESIVIHYTAYVDEVLFDYNFVNAVCARIAYELAEVLTQDERKKQLWMNEYLLAIKDAKRVNAIQLPNLALGSGILERARIY